MLGRRSVVFIALVILIAILAGCSSDDGVKPATLSKGEKEQLIKQLNAVFIDRYPNDKGLAKIYCEISNGTKMHLISATVVATDVVTKGKNTVYGRLVVENVKPGKSKPFEIVTGRGINEIGDTVMLSITDAEFGN